MTISKSRVAYRDVYDNFDKALGDSRGIRLPFNSYNEAKSYQFRMNTARALDRRENEKIYPKGDPMHGQSQYDTLQVRIVGPIEDSESPTGQTAFVYVEPRDKGVPEAEMLSEIEDENGQTIQ